LDVTFIDDEDLATPWKREASSSRKLSGNMPASLTVTLANLIHFEKDQLPQALANRLIRQNLASRPGGSSVGDVAPRRGKAGRFLPIAP
jgi:hypothetical protein